MSIAVLIPTYRRSQDLARCLTALQKQTRRADEVLVVIRDTDTETRTFLEGFNSELLSLAIVTVKRTGVVAAMNAGLDRARSDIIAITVAFGDPEPGKIRVWSTMHDMGTFGSTIAIGLLLLFNQQGTLLVPTSIAGYLSLLLTSSRTAWGLWIVGLFTLASSLKTKQQIRLVTIVTIIALCVVPLTMLESFSENISSRFQTLKRRQRAEGRRQKVTAKKRRWG
jgi:glycosyltransferase involved in cell wall biosynthesis